MRTSRGIVDALLSSASAVQALPFVCYQSTLLLVVPYTESSVSAASISLGRCALAISVLYFVRHVVTHHVGG
jgi:hypothetical protein